MSEYTVVSTSVTRLGYFLIIFVTNSFLKLHKIFSFFLGWIEIYYLFRKYAVATFSTTFGEIWATFNYIIWSHWSLLNLSFSIFKTYNFRNPNLHEDTFGFSSGFLLGCTLSYMSMVLLLRIEPWVELIKIS